MQFSEKILISTYFFIRLQIVPNKQLENLETEFIKLKKVEMKQKPETPCLNGKDRDGTIRILRNIASGSKDRSQCARTHEPLEVTKRKKWGKVIAEPEE